MVYGSRPMNSELEKLVEVAASVIAQHEFESDFGPDKPMGGPSDE